MSSWAIWFPIKGNLLNENFGKTRNLIMETPVKNILITLTLMSFALAACTPSSDKPVSSDNPAPTQSSDNIPTPDDSGLTHGEVYLDSVDLLTMESFPLQFMLVLKGSLPTPCHELRVAVSPPDPQNKIVVHVYSVVDPNMMCAQVLEPFEENSPLGSFPTGHYTLWVNGEQVAEFDA
jgi:hypothetical protein